MDNLDHCFCMFQVPTTKISTERDLPISTTEKAGVRGGAVRRVDLIVTPPKQFPFAVLGWTGSKVPTH